MSEDPKKVSNNNLPNSHIEGSFISSDTVEAKQIGNNTNNGQVNNHCVVNNYSANPPQQEDFQTLIAKLKTTQIKPKWIFSGHSDKVNCLAISPDSKILVSASADKTIKVWNLENSSQKHPRQLYKLEGHTDKVRSLAISYDGKTLVSGSDDKTVRIWNLNTRKEVHKIGGGFIAEYLDSITSLAIMSEETFISGSLDHKIKLWNLKTKQKIGELPSNPSISEQWGANCVAVADTSYGQVIASDCANYTIKLYRWDTKEVLHFPDYSHSGPIWSIAISPNGKFLASGSEDYTVKLWSLETGKLLHSLKQHDDAVYSVNFGWNGQIIASGSHDQTIKLWSVENGELISTITGNENAVKSIAISPNGQIIASADGEKIKIWHLW